MKRTEVTYGQLDKDSCRLVKQGPSVRVYEPKETWAEIVGLPFTTRGMAPKSPACVSGMVMIG
jgi:hypothetical protein